MKVIKTKKMFEAVERFGAPTDKIDEVNDKIYSQMPYATSDAIKRAKKAADDANKSYKDQIKQIEKDDALKNTEKDRVEPIKVKSSDLKKMHLSEKLENKFATLDDFLKDAEVILVDDARTFDINKYEKDYLADMVEELGATKLDGEVKDDIKDRTESDVKFIKYTLDDAAIVKIVEKLKTSDICITDYWKTKQFLKKRHLEKGDLDGVIHNLTKDDYVTNSKSVDGANNEACIFVKKEATIKDLGPFNLYIKLDYDSIEKTPVIVISIHENYKHESLKEAVESAEFDIEELSKDYNPVAEQFADNGDGLFSVKLADDNVEFTTWIDVTIRDDDVEADWNSTIFHMSDPRDRFYKEMQENTDVYTKASDTAINYLLDEGVITQEDDGSWHVVVKEVLKEAKEAEYNKPIGSKEIARIEKIMGDMEGDAKNGYYLFDEDECAYARKAIEKEFGQELRLDFVKVTEDDPNFEDFKWRMKVTKAANRDGVADDLYADVIDAITRGASVYSIKRPKALKIGENGKPIYGYDYLREVSVNSDAYSTTVSVIAPDIKGLDFAVKTADYYGLNHNIKKLPTPIKGDADSRFPYYNYRCDIVIPKFMISDVEVKDEDND